MSRSSRHVPRPALVIAGALTAATLTACLAAPIPLARGRTTMYGHRDFKPQLPHAPAGRELDRRAVILALGEPDAAAPGGEWIVYASDCVEGTWLGVGMGGAAAGPVIADYGRTEVLLAAFDSRGTLIRHEERSLDGFNLYPSQLSELGRTWHAGEPIE